MNQQTETEELSGQAYLLNIIKKLEELDKIKKIILSEQQLKLFDLMQQPIKEEELLISDEEDPESQNDKQKQQLTKIQEGFEAYASITKQFEQSEIDTKIIQNLDPQLLDIFNQNQQTQFLQEQKINNKSNQVIQNQQLSAIIKQIDVSTNFSPMKIDHDTQIDDSSKNQSYIQKLDKFTLLKDGSCNNSSNIKNNQDQDYDEVIQINCNESKAKDNQITNNRSFTNECSLIVFSSNTTQNKFD